MNKYKLTALFIAAITLFSGCFSQETEEIKQETPLKEVNIFTVGRGENLSFTKSGEVTSASKALIMPETTGKVTQISVKLGDKVRKGQTLITLGDSIASEVTNMNYDLAQKGVKLSTFSQNLLEESEITDLNSVLLAYESAKAGLENAIKAKDSAEDLYDEQSEGLDESVDKLKSQLKDLEQTPDYQQDPTYQELKAQYETLKSTQDQTEIGHDAQTDQLDAGIEMARRGVQSAILGMQTLQTKYGMQFIQSSSALLQAQNGADIAALQKEALNVKSPINGTVTSIEATVNNLTAPGQIVAIVQNLDSMEVTTSINSDELQLVKVGDKVTVSVKSGTGAKTAEGTVTEVSPSLSSSNKKIAVKIALNSGSTLLSGEFVEVKFKPQTASIFVPLKAVTIEDDKYFVKLVKNRTIEKHEISAGRILGTFIEVTSGLKPEEMIAFSDSTFIQEGDKVTYKVPRI